jgi:hypothetical protein
MNGQPVEEIDPRLVYVMAGMNRVPIQKDIVYKTSENTALRADVYRPPDMEAGERRHARLPEPSHRPSCF